MEEQAESHVSIHSSARRPFSERHQRRETPPSAGGAFADRAGGLESRGAGSMEDFKSTYCGSRTLLEHRDPYSPNDVLDVYLRRSGERSTDPSVLGQRQGMTFNVYLHPALLCLAPIALLPWGPAHILWLALTAGILPGVYKDMRPRLFPGLLPEHCSRTALECYWLEMLPEWSLVSRSSVSGA